jgi:hypothetical protein
MEGMEKIDIEKIATAEKKDDNENKIQILRLVEENDIVTYKVHYDKHDMSIFFRSIINQYGKQSIKSLNDVYNKDVLKLFGDEVVEQQIIEIKPKGKSLIGQPKKYNIAGIVRDYPAIYKCLNDIIASNEIDLTTGLMSFLRHLNGDSMNQINCLKDFINLLKLKELDRIPIDELKNKLHALKTLEATFIKPFEKDLYYFDKGIRIAKENANIIDLINNMELGSARIYK